MRSPFLRKLTIPLSLAFVLFLAGCQGGQPPAHPADVATGAPDTTALAGLARVTVPPGFAISIYAKVPGARNLCRGNKALFAGTMTGTVYAVTDQDGNGTADHVYTVASGLDMPNGVAFRNGSLYVAEHSRIIRFDDIEKRLDNPPAYKIVYDGLPKDREHGWKFIAFGPDGKLYVPVGAPCNICLPDNPVFATINRMNPDGTGFENFARGIRNSLGFDWDPATRELWFTDNGRDQLGDTIPSDELNHAPKPGLHFGFPFCHQGNIPDPEFGKQHDCSEFTPPSLRLGAHVAALGMRFYTGTMFPEEYRNQIFLAEHGSWNRTVPDGYRVMTVKKVNGQLELAPFATGWLDSKGNVSGRPTDVCVAADGALFISDDKGGFIYKVVYRKS